MSRVATQKEKTRADVVQCFVARINQFRFDNQLCARLVYQPPSCQQGMGNSINGRLSGPILQDLVNNTRFTEDQLQEYYLRFMSEHPAGEVSKAKFIEQCRKDFGNDNTEFFEHMFNSLDLNHDGVINFKEYVMAVSLTLKGSTRDKLRWAFEMADSDHSGYLDRNELIVILRTVLRAERGFDSYNLGRETMTDEQIDAYANKMFLAMDKNHDNKVSLEEFLSTCMSNTEYFQVLNRIQPNTK